MNNIRYYIERIYPYFIAFVIGFIMQKNNINLIDDENMNEALNAVNTITTLIIGFLGAILPVILGMKNESKIVKYVFEKDSHKLFLKYIKSTIIVGLFLVGITVLLYFRNNFNPDLKKNSFYIWMFMLILFLMCTYRSLSNMLNLIFSRDSDLESYSKGNSIEKTNKEKELEKKYKLE